MIVEPDFLTHWKTQMLVVELEDNCAPLYVIALWAHCQQRKSDRFTVTPNALKAICRYPGDGSRLAAALEACGFVNVEEGVTVVRGWAEVNATLVSNWYNGKKGGRPPQPKAKTGSGRENPPETQSEIGLTQQEPNSDLGYSRVNPAETQSGNGVTQQEPIREEKRREDRIGEEKTEKKKEQVARPGDISEEHWNDWIAVRRAKRAGPVTATALARLRKQARLAGVSDDTAVEVSAAKGWQNFEAGWYAKLLADEPARSVSRVATLEDVQAMMYGSAAR